MRSRFSGSYRIIIGVGRDSGERLQTEVSHGFELCMKVKEDTGLQGHPKIIIMSSLYRGLKYQLDAAKTYCADGYLVKPFTKEELLSKIEVLF